MMSGVNATPSNEPDNRRKEPRSSLQTRAAAWFDIGPAAGVTLELRDISLSGFGVLGPAESLAPFMKGKKAMYAVILLEGAHMGCMARLANAANAKNGRLGFMFDAMPEDSQRMLKGLVACMATRNAEAGGRS